jgi:hypothetical protein
VLAASRVDGVRPQAIEIEMNRRALGKCRFVVAFYRGSIWQISLGNGRSSVDAALMIEVRLLLPGHARRRRGNRTTAQRKHAELFVQGVHGPMWLWPCSAGFPGSRLPLFHVDTFEQFVAIGEAARVWWLLMYSVNKATFGNDALCQRTRPRRRR